LKTLDVKILDPRLREALPQYSTDGAAGLDLRACIQSPLTLAPGAADLVPSGIAIHLADPGLAAVVLPRSGLVTNTASSSGISWASSTPTTRGR